MYSLNKREVTGEKAVATTPKRAMVYLMRYIFAVLYLLHTAESAAVMYPTPNTYWCKSVRVLPEEMYKLHFNNSKPPSGARRSNTLCKTIFLPPTPGTQLCVEVDPYFTKAYGKLGFVISEFQHENSILYDFQSDPKYSKKDDFKSLQYDFQRCTSQGDGLSMQFYEVKGKGAKTKFNMSLSISSMPDNYRRAYFVEPCHSQIVLHDTLFRIDKQPLDDHAIHFYYAEERNQFYEGVCAYDVSTLNNKSSDSTICLAYKPLGAKMTCENRWEIGVVTGESISELMYNLTCGDENAAQVHAWCAPVGVSALTITFKQQDRDSKKAGATEKERPPGFLIIIGDYPASKPGGFLSYTRSEYKRLSLLLRDDTKWKVSESRNRDNRKTEEEVAEHLLMYRWHYAGLTAMGLLVIYFLIFLCIYFRVRTGERSSFQMNKDKEILDQEAQDEEVPEDHVAMAEEDKSI